MTDVSSPSHRAIYYWGFINCFLLIFQQFGNAILQPLGAQKLIYGSMVGWIITALWTKRATIRIPAAIAFILVIQVWFGICTMHAQAKLGMHVVFNGMDLLLAVYALIFVQSSCLVWFAPEARRSLGRVIIVICVLSPFFAFLQFAGFGPAQQLAAIIRSAEIAFAIGSGDEVIRAPGLHSNIGNAVVYSCAVAVAIVSVVQYRVIRWYELFAIGMLFLGSLLVQVRNQLALILIAGVWVLIALIKAYRSKGTLIGGLGVGAIMAFLLTRKDAFGYFFQQGTGTLDFRRDFLWPQAYNVLKYEPIFGIGVEPAFAGWSTQVFPNRWLTHSVIDNGFLLAAIFGGWPGMMLLVVTCAAALFGALRLLAAPHEDGWHLAFKRMLLMIVLFFITGMYWGTLWANPITMAVFFVMAGLAMPSMKSEQLEYADYEAARQVTAGRS